jgi:(p)ppGpp synthase/HD superfamily hydrolase
MTGHRYAQTNLQLYRQLQEDGRPTRHVLLVSQAYELALPLFSAQVRSSGKPFLAHLVGTASILAAIGWRAEVVAAGLLHAAYAQGDWGDGHQRLIPQRSQRVQRAVGREVEALVVRYTEYPWNPTSIKELAGRARSFELSEVDVVTMRLANLLEDHLDLGMAYARKGAKDKQADDVHARCAQIAEAMGHHRLAAELDEAFAETRDAALPRPLVRSARGSTTMPPLSYRPRAHTVAGETVRRARKKLSRRLR